jgi:hypothetical protein
MLSEDEFVVSKGVLKTIKGQNGAERLFCGHCGTGIAYKNQNILPDLLDVQSATLDEPDAYIPEMNIQLADQIGWESTAHDLPGFDRFPPQE